MNIFAICIYFALICNSVGRRRPRHKPRPTRAAIPPTPTAVPLTLCTKYSVTTSTMPTLDPDFGTITPPPNPESEVSVDESSIADMAMAFLEKKPASCYSDSLQQLGDAAKHVLIDIKECPFRIQNVNRLRRIAAIVKIEAEEADKACLSSELGSTFTPACFIIATAAMIKLIKSTQQKSQELTFVPYIKDKKNFACIERSVNHLKCKIMMLPTEVVYCSIKFALDAVDVIKNVKNEIKNQVVDTIIELPAEIVKGTTEKSD